VIPARSPRRDAASFSGGGVFARAADSGVEAEVNRLRADLVAYLLRKTRGAGDAEDVVQEAFVRFHRAGHDLNSADARPLLFVIARNIQLDRWKAGSRETARRSAHDIHDLDKGPRAIASETPDAETGLIRRQGFGRRRRRDPGPAAEDPRRFSAAPVRIPDLSPDRHTTGVSVSMVEKHIAEALRQLKKSRGD
jgi:DNA-directed RNA polymerase specialized sigma24 family protein